MAVHVSANRCESKTAWVLRHGAANLLGADALRVRAAKLRAGGAASDDTPPWPPHTASDPPILTCSDAERFVMRLREDTPKPTRKPRTPSLRTQAKYISREMSEQFGLALRDAQLRAGLAQKDLARRARVSCLPP